MLIQSIAINNFRSHQRSEIVCEPITALLGPTGAGKTSIIDALAYALAGANQFTARDGKQAQNLIRIGPDELSIVVNVEGWGTVHRTRRDKTASLMVPGAVNGTTATNQALILQHLKISQEALLASLDAAPLLTRSPADQHGILCRLLPPPSIDIDQRLIDAGVPRKIMGVEHLDQLIRDWKDNRLRDLNRERKRLEGINPKPEWPIPGHTEEQVDELWTKVSAKRDTLLRYQALIGALIGDDTEKLAKIAKKPSATEVDPKLVAKLQKQIAQEKANVAAWQPDCDERDRGIAEMRGRYSGLNLQSVQIEKRLMGLATAKFEPHCETCTCPMAALRDDVQEQIGSLKLEFGEIELERTEIEKRIAAHGQTNRVTLDAISAGQKRIADWQDELAKLEKVSEPRETRQVIERRMEDSQTRLAEVNTKLAACDERLKKGQEYREAITRYKGERAAAQQHAKDYIAITRDRIPQTESVLRELQGLRESLLQQHVGGFLTDMQAVLSGFGLHGLAYDVENGFFFSELNANYLSTGQSHMLFEVAFRIAAAKRTGLGLVVLDHVAPVDEEHRTKIQQALVLSGHQVIMTWTMSEKPKAPPVPTVARYWCEIQGGVTVLSEV